MHTAKAEWKELNEDEEGLPDFERARAQLIDTDTATCRALHANSLNAQVLKWMTPLHKAIVTYLVHEISDMYCSIVCDYVMQ